MKLGQTPPSLVLLLIVFAHMRIVVEKRNAQIRAAASLHGVSAFRRPLSVLLFSGCGVAEEWKSHSSFLLSIVADSVIFC